MRQDPDPWFSNEFWQRAVLGVLMLALAFLLATPLEAGAAACHPAPAHAAAC